MREVLFTALLLLTTVHRLASQAQRANYWPLQEGAALDFSNGQPQLVQQCALWSFEASGAICDEQGQLQLYSNGGGRDSPTQPKGTIWNKNHTVLYDMGNTEGGGYSAMQGATIIPAPGKPHHYYVLTMEEAEFDANGGGVPGQPMGRGFSAFLVNMEANGGLGAVVAYQPMLYVPAYEGLCAIQHPNCRDYWVIVADNNTHELLVFPITSQGIGAAKRFNFSTPFDPVYVGGASIRATPDAKHVLAGRYLFRFDPITGELSQKRKLNLDILFAEFSPGSRYLYIQRTFEMLRIDILASNPDATLEVVADLGAIGLGERGPMQLGPDGSIWFRSRPSNSNDDFLHAVRQPDEPDAFVETKVLTLPTGSSTPLLPDFPAQWFASTPAATPQVQLGPDLALCSDSVLLVPSGIVGFPVVWSTGDTLETLPVTIPGTYIATVLGCSSTSDTIVIQENSCACPIQIPNAFTPNGDQFNDTFGPADAPAGYTLRIWNRWGQLVFQNAGNGSDTWDGTFNGKPVLSDVYVYQMQWDDCQITRKGEISLLR
jgi:gliding motility-associated-like protein